MPIKILMPALSPTMEHGNLAKWAKQEGDTITAGEVIAEIETDKATMEVEAVDEGRLAKIIVPEGAQEIPVNALIAVLLEEDEDDSNLDTFIANATKEDSKSGVSEILDVTISDQAQSQSQTSTSTSSELPIINDNTPVSNKSLSKRIFASPLAKRIAEKDGVDLRNISGTGPYGRIIKADLSSVVKSSNTQILRNATEYRLSPNSNMRKIIAKRLTESKSTVPHFYLAIECITDTIIEARMQINANANANDNTKLSLNDFVILAASKALVDVPDANASWSEDAIMLYNNVDISVAVAIDGGLITPVIRNSDQKNIIMISNEMKELVRKAKNNSLSPEEFQGGGFSISNLGMYGVKSFNAIINPPQGCILSIGMSSKRFVIVNDKPEIKNVLDVNLSCDHRVVDGTVGAQFLAAFKKYIESPILMFV